MTLATSRPTSTLTRSTHVSDAYEDILFEVDPDSRAVLDDGLNTLLSIQLFEVSQHLDSAALRLHLDALPEGDSSGGQVWGCSRRAGGVRHDSIQPGIRLANTGGRGRLEV